MCVCVGLFVCVGERERETMLEAHRECLCLRVFVCVGERERETRCSGLVVSVCVREGDRENERGVVEARR